MKNTREVILERALALFNEKGVEYGGVRELAGLLDIRVSNITYYFATKDDLLGAIAAKLAESNSAIFQKYDCKSVRNLLEMYSELFHNQYVYRCLMVSFVHMFNHHPGLAERYKVTEKKRRAWFDEKIRMMVSNGYLKKDLGEAQIMLMVSHISLISRFWISEARVSYSDRSLDDIISHYLVLLSEVFHPYLTAKGKKDVQDFLKG